MTVNGIIAEYNPFHNGHKIHIDTSKRTTGADYTIVVMSGNFTQRGTPALIDKFDRAKMALTAGADLVLELPIINSCSSAEYFAEGGIALLDKLGVVTHISFGSESGNVGNLSKVAKILSEEPEGYAEALRRNMRTGMTYPIARNQALIEYDPSLYDVSSILSSPNNILAIEYLKAIEKRHSSIVPYSMKRETSNYHDRYATSAFSASALAIREMILHGNDYSMLGNLVPSDSYDILLKNIENNKLIDLDDFSSMLLYKLISEKDRGFSQYLDVSQTLSDRIIKNLHRFESFSQFCDILKSKNHTYTRINRSLLHILLNITDSLCDTCKMLDYVPYARILGFRKDSEALLTAIKSQARIPLISKLADAENVLYEEPLKILKNEIKIDEYYYAIAGLKSKSNVQNEYSTPIVIV